MQRPAATQCRWSWRLTRCEPIQCHWSWRSLQCFCGDGCIQALETHPDDVLPDSAVTDNIRNETAFDAVESNGSAPIANDSSNGPISRLEQEDPNGYERMLQGLLALVVLQLLAWALRKAVASWGRQRQEERDSERHEGYWQRLELRRACRTWAKAAAWHDLWQRVELLAEEQLLRRGFVPWVALAKDRTAARSRKAAAEEALAKERAAAHSQKAAAEEAAQLQAEAEAAAERARLEEEERKRAEEETAALRAAEEAAERERIRAEDDAAAAKRAFEKERAAEKLQAAARERAHDKLRASRLELWEKKTTEAQPTTEAPRPCLPGLQHRWVRTTPSVIRRMDTVVAAAQAQARGSKLPPQRTAGAARPVASPSGKASAASPVGLRRRVTAASPPGSAGRANAKMRSPAGAAPASPASAAPSPGTQWGKVRSLAVSPGNRAELEVLWRCRYCGQEISLTGTQKPDP